MIVDKFFLRGRECFNIRVAYRRTKMSDSQCVFYNTKTGKCKSDRCNDKRRDKDGTCLIKGTVTWLKYSAINAI